ncbi:MAG: hypothetical protein P0S93_06435 [Candidatus Neptunochlamydia sp.]|nr:hypothetical protein [Candidatus Neptunochlamydia sp.]
MVAPLSQLLYGTVEDDSSKEFFGTFSACLFKVDRNVIQHFFLNENFESKKVF